MNKTAPSQIKSSVEYIKRKKESGARDFKFMLLPEQAQHLAAYRLQNPDFNLTAYLRECVMRLGSAPNT